jgi:hypothetical protein
LKGLLLSHRSKTILSNKKDLSVLYYIEAQTKRERNLPRPMRRPSSAWAYLLMKRIRKEKFPINMKEI